MGSDLCPATAKDMMNDIHKDNQQSSYQFIFKGCLSPPGEEPSKVNQIIENAREHLAKETNFSQQPTTIHQTTYIHSQNHLDAQLHKQSDKQFRQIEPISLVELNLEDGGRYVGPAINGIPNGEGEEFYECGDYFKGDFENGVKHGMGIYRFANSQVYEGQFKHNLMDGHGKFTFSNGDIYEGRFVQNLRCGFGRYMPKQPNFQEILYFEGEYHNDLKEGSGRIIYEDHQFKGKWRNGLYVCSLNDSMIH